MKLNRFVSLVFMPFMIGLGYVPYLLVGEMPRGFASHAFALAGGFIFWTIYLGMQSGLGRPRPKRDLSDWQWILSAFGVLAGYGAFLGIIVIGMGYPLIRSADGHAVDWARFVTMARIWLLVSAYYIFCLIAFWTRYRVDAQALAVLDGRVLRGGTRFRLWPWISYDSWTVPSVMPVAEALRALEFSDVSFDVRVRTSVELDLEAAKRNKIDRLDVPGFVAEVRQWLHTAIRYRMRGATYGQVLLGKVEPEPVATAVQGVPVLWRGRVEIA